MTKEEAIKSIERHIKAHGIGEYPHVFIGEALKMAIAALQAQKDRTLDRSRWWGCDTCNNTPGIMFGVITMSIGKRFLSTDEHELKYCPECGRPLTEEAWAELEGRIGGNDGTADTH